jgi:hypothetical protein
LSAQDVRRLRTRCEKTIVLIRTRCNALDQNVRRLRTKYDETEDKNKMAEDTMFTG